MFGLAGTLATAGGRAKLLLHLLSPQGRSDHAGSETILKYPVPASDKRTESPLPEVYLARRSLECCPDKKDKRVELMIGTSIQHPGADRNPNYKIIILCHCKSIRTGTWPALFSNRQPLFFALFSRSCIIRHAF